jgi:hypothetical protein
VLRGTVFREFITSKHDLQTRQDVLRAVRIGFPNYVKGFLCAWLDAKGIPQGCSSCYVNVRDNRGDLIPLVKIDPLHGLPKPRDVREGKGPRKGFNTRVTQGRSGSRV